MYNEATNHIRANKSTATNKTKATASTAGRVLRMDATNKGRRRDQEGQAAVRSRNYVANAFLKTSFLPKLKGTKLIQDCRKIAKMERDFYTSLSRLAEHYNIELMQTKSYEYPYNFTLAIWDAQRKLKENVKYWDGLQLVQDSKKTFFISEERYRTGRALYYIPVSPLHQMLDDPQRQSAAQLLLSVFSYLYHIADIPYYRQEDSYLYWQYEMIKEWVAEDEETDSCEIYENELLHAEKVGDCIEKLIFDRNNLKVFEDRLTNFNCRDDYDRECVKVASDAFSLYTDYPNENVFRNVPSSKAEHDEDEDEDVYENGMIGLEKYVSFFADSKGILYESLSSNMDTEFNEYGQLEEPVIEKKFNGKSITGSLDFEDRLFNMMDDLCYLLYHYKGVEL